MIDLKVIESFDGGDLVLKGNDLEVVSGFGNMPYLAMFGGNVGEVTPVLREEGEQAFDWWGNSFNEPLTQFNSYTEKALIDNPLNSGGRLFIEQAVKRDLKFMEAFADLDISVLIVGIDKVRIEIKQTEPSTREERESSFLWDGALVDLSEERIARPSPINGFATVRNTTGSYIRTVRSGDLLVLDNPIIDLNSNPIGNIVSQEPVSVNLSDGTNPITPDAVNLVGNTLGITILRPFFGFDPTYRQVLLTAQAAGITLPSAGVQVLQNQLMINMKANGSWTKSDVMYVFAHDGAAAFGCINWKNPLRHFAQLVNAVGFTPNQGVSGDAVSARVDTMFVPSLDGVNYQLNNASRYFYLYQAGGATRFMDGGDVSANAMEINGLQSRINSPGVLSTFNFGTNREMKSIQRVISTEQIDYKAKAGTVVLNTGATALTAFRQQLFVSAGVYSSHTCSFYMMGASMVAENDDIVDDFDAYINAL